MRRGTKQPASQSEAGERKTLKEETLKIKLNIRGLKPLPIKMRPKLCRQELDGRGKEQTPVYLFVCFPPTFQGRLLIILKNEFGLLFKNWNDTRSMLPSHQMLELASVLFFSRLCNYLKQPFRKYKSTKSSKLKG